MRRRLLGFPVFETVFAIIALLIVLLPFSNLFPTLATALASFCVWLTVRVVNRRERWAKWTLAAAIGLPVLYVASFGPACWISSRANVGQRDVAIIYSPLTWMFGKSDTTFAAYAILYAEAGAADDWHWNVMPRTAFRHIRWEWHHDEPDSGAPPAPR